MDKKTMIYLGCGLGGIVLVIIIISIIANTLTNGIKNYSDLERKLETASKKYYEKNADLLPTVNGETVEVTSDVLTSNNYIADIKELYKGDLCSGKVEVTKVEDNYLYIATLTCDKYSTITLSEKIIRDTVTEGDGLYKINNGYVFKGENVNNYIKFSDKLWRIINIDDSMNLKIISTDSYYDDIVWDDRYNLDRGTDDGKNVYSMSRMKDYLQELYDDNSLISKEYKSYLVPYNWCIRPYDMYENKLFDNTCTERTEKQFVGLLDAMDYSNASMESECKYFDSVSCTNYNYMVFLEKRIWTMNSVKDNTYQVYSLSSRGTYARNASNQTYVLPAVYLNGLVHYTSGIGTETEPYIIK